MHVCTAIPCRSEHTFKSSFILPFLACTHQMPREARKRETLNEMMESVNKKQNSYDPQYQVACDPVSPLSILLLYILVNITWMNAGLIRITLYDYFIAFISDYFTAFVSFSPPPSILIHTRMIYFSQVSSSTSHRPSCFILSQRHIIPRSQRYHAHILFPFLFLPSCWTL